MTKTAWKLVYKHHRLQPSKLEKSFPEYNVPVFNCCFQVKLCEKSRKNAPFFMPAHGMANNAIQYSDAIGRKTNGTS